ncbi:MAG: carboxypeptidase regulatory-like domain-containing protein [Candidatus Thermoplasmatota archaeon]|nr:carboxypeptidase regulatory-like domain-containing protein [Candidatus Thermoplasmatota archaeon]
MQKKKKLQQHIYVLLICFLVGIATIFGPISIASHKMNQPEDSIIAAIELTYSDTLKTLDERGVIILAIDKPRESAVVLVSPQDFLWLSEHHLRPQIVPDEIAEKQGWKYTADFERDFHNYAQMTTELQSIASSYPAITALYNLGQSVQGRIIWGLKITDNPSTEEDEPEIRVCGVHHGNEYMGAELSLLLAQYLTQNYATNSTVATLVNSREIWIMPMVNPDGREMSTRDNANGVDLNRDYGYMWGGQGGSPAPFSQPETQIIRANALDNYFVLSLSYHTTAEIVNYIWNYKHQRVPDNTVVEYLSNKYGSHNGYWVVEGYDWYQTMGDTNDFSYGCRGDIDWTIETPNTNIPAVWELHREAMFDIIKGADLGLRGIVTDAQTGQPLAATVWVEEAYWPCFSDPLVGDYHKPLMPGSYHVAVRANGYQEQEFTVEVYSGHPTYLNVTLSRENSFFGYQITIARFVAPSNNFQNNPTEAIAALGPPDESCASLGVGGYIVIDMKDNITDGEDSDFRVYEGDGVLDGYSVYGSSYWNGPWSMIGAGMGTTEFDLGDVSLESVRYLKILDDGNGNPGEVNPGCDIDAVENLAAANANLPPNIPATPSGPQVGIVNATYSYMTSTTDPESSQVYYLWSWGDENSSWLGPFDSGASVQATHDWNTAGNYSVKVKAKDGLGVESGWSDPLLVCIQAGPLIEIGQITTGFGRIRVQITNTGARQALNVSWSILLNDGLVLLGRQTTGAIQEIAPGSSSTIQSRFLFGLGRISIAISADDTEKTISGVLFGPFVIIKS